DRPRVKRALTGQEKQRPGRIAAQRCRAGNGPLPIEERAATTSDQRDIAIRAKDSQAFAAEPLLECFPEGSSTSAWIRTHRDARSSPANSLCPGESAALKARRTRSTNVQRTICHLNTP